MAWQSMDIAPDDGNLRLYGAFFTNIITKTTEFEWFELYRDDEGAMRTRDGDYFTDCEYEDFEYWLDVPPLQWSDVPESYMISDDSINAAELYRVDWQRQKVETIAIIRDLSHSKPNQWMSAWDGSPYIPKPYTYKDRSTADQKLAAGFENCGSTR